MAKRAIVMLGDEILRKKARPVTEFNERLAELLDDMAETMYARDGVGLAANQVGILRRVVVVDVGEGLMELINPVLEKASGEQIGPEGCLSVAGRHGSVARPQKIKVRACDRTGKEFTVVVKDYAAVAVCHEMDHLDGVLFIDKILPEEETDER